MLNSVSPSQARVGVIDLGSNTILLLVLAEGDRVILERARITRLGRGVFTSHVLDPAAAELTRQTLVEFAAEARALGASPLVGVGTEALRRARDGEDFLRRLCADRTLDAARLLSGHEEAELAIEASRRSFGGAVQPLVVIDVGGGSTEVAWSLARGGVRGLSLPLGSVRLTEAFIRRDPPAQAEIEQVERSIDAAMADLRTAEGLTLPLTGSAAVVAVAGTATTLAALELELDPYDPEPVEGFPLDEPRLRHWIGRLARLPLAQRRGLRGMEAGRADVIVAGLMALAGVLSALGSPRFRVSGRGVRHGVALRLLEGDRGLW